MTGNGGTRDGARRLHTPLPRLFLDQTEAWRAGKKFWEMAQALPPTPLPKGLDDRPLSLGLNPALTGVLLLYRQCFLKGFCI